MIYHIYTFKRKSSGFAFNPVFSQLEPKQYIESLNQNMYDFKPDELAKYIDFEVHHVGTFDNISCNVVSIDDHEIVDLASMASLALKVVSKNEPKSN